MHTYVRRVLGFTILTGTLLAPVTSYALEPANNQAPWKTPTSNTSAGKIDTTLYFSNALSGVSWPNSENIATSSDVDYVILSCPKVGKIGQVYIDFTHSVGDLDLEVYDMAGTLLGSSAGTSNRELVFTDAFNLRVIVLKVYGYNGATGNYGPGFTCV